MLRQTVRRPAFLGVKPHLETRTRFVTLTQVARCVLVGHPLWREDESLIYNDCWFLLAQSISDPSPDGLTAIFYTLRFETPPIWSTRSQDLYLTATRWPGYVLRHLVAFSSPPTTPRATVELLELVFARVRKFSNAKFTPYVYLSRTAQKTSLATFP